MLNNKKNIKMGYSKKFLNNSTTADLLIIKKYLLQDLEKCFTTNDHNLFWSLETELRIRNVNKYVKISK